MKNRVTVLGGLLLLGAMAAPADSAAQQFPGTSSILNSPATRSLMLRLGYAPGDFCGFYFFLSTKNTGQFSDPLLKALLPLCAEWPQPVISGGTGGEEGGEEGGQGGSGSTGGGQGDAGWPGGGGSTGEGQGGGEGGSGEGGSGEGGSGDAGWPGSGGSTGGGGGEEGGGDPFGGGGAMATPEPVSLILLGTGLMGVGGFGAARRRRKDPED